MGENILNHISDNTYLKYIKNSYNPIAKTTKNSRLKKKKTKRVENLNRFSSREDIQLANRYMK